MHTHISTYIHTCIHTYIYTYIHTHTYIYIHIYIRTYIYIHTYIYTYVHIYIHAYIHTYIYTYIHTYIHTYIPTHIRTYIHTLNFLQIFEKYSNTEFIENPFSGNRVVPCGRTDMTKITVAFPNYDRAPKNWPDEKLSPNEHQDYHRGGDISIDTITLYQWPQCHSFL